MFFKGNFYIFKVSIQGSRSPDFFPKVKKCFFFPNSTKKFPIFLFFLFWFSIFISYTYLQFQRIITFASFSPFCHSILINIHYNSLIIGINLAIGNIIHKDDVKFNFSQNAANFPNSMGPAGLEISENRHLPCITKKYWHIWGNFNIH